VFVVIDHAHKIQIGLNNIRCCTFAAMNADVSGWNDYRFPLPVLGYGNKSLLSLLLACRLLLQVVSMKVRCAICGFEGYVTVWQDWYRSQASMPDIWICDLHRVGVA